MRFAVLGPLEVWDGDRPVAVVRPRRRAVLGYLLSQANHAVSVSELVDAVWGTTPPKTIRSQVHATVSELRRALASSGPERLSSGPSGYTLTAAEEELDSAQFRLRLARARELTDRGDDGPAADELRVALALWRGELLAGVDAPFIWALRAPAEEERFAACEALADIELRRGRHQALVPELAAWLERYPTRESIAERLTVALCRGGRQADALEVIRKLRGALADELGVGLGPRLAGLQKQVLAMDPDLFGADERPGAAPRPAPPMPPATPVSPPAPPAPPAQLPPAARAFIGRQAELERLAAHLASAADVERATPVALIHGMGGVGKTALATRLGHHVADAYPDGQIYLNMSGSGATAPAEPRDALAAALTALGVSAAAIPDDAEGASALLRSRLSGVRVLIVLDNVASAAQVRPFVSATAGCAVVATSRSRLAALDGVLRVPLAPLGREHGRELLAAIAGEARVVADPSAADGLVDVCGGLPLALRVIAARLLARPLRSLRSILDQLRTDGSGRLERFDYDDLSVRRSLDVAYLPLTASVLPAERAAALALRRIGALDLVHYPVPLVGHLMGADVVAAGAALERLADLALADETRDGYYTLHDLVRHYVHDHIAADTADAADTAGTAASDLGADSRGLDERRRVLSQALRWYGSLAGSSVHALIPARAAELRAPAEVSGPRDRFPDAPAALAWFDGELPNLRRLVDECRNSPETYPELSALVRMLFPALRQRTLFAELETFTTLVRDQAAALGDAAGRAQALSDLAEVHILRGRTHEAVPLLEEACGLWEAEDPAGWRPYSLAKLGGALATLDRADEAVAILEEALELAIRAGDSAVEGIILGNLGLAFAQLEDIEASIDHHLRSLAAGRAVGSPALQLAAHGNIGLAYLEQLEDGATALPHFEKALSIVRATDAGWYNERQTLLGLSHALYLTGRYQEVVSHCMVLLAGAEIAEDRHGRGMTLYRYGYALQALQGVEAAVPHWRQALDDLSDSSETRTVEDLRRLLEPSTTPPEPVNGQGSRTVT